jgi:DMSO/TMAO reductase YedYZ molybdopterin-dependent catalytic subunit
VILMTHLSIQGLLEGAPLELSADDLRALPEAYQVPDVGEHVKGRTGRAIRFRALLHDRDLQDGARWIDLESTDGFAASLPIEEIADDGLILYATAEAALTEDDGGPFRLMIPGYRDACASVKHLASIAFSDQPGKDTRPKTDPDSCTLERDT